MLTILFTHCHTLIMGIYLLQAVRGNCPEIVSFLLRYYRDVSGIRIEEWDKYDTKSGRTPLAEAVHLRYLKCVHVRAAVKKFANVVKGFLAHNQLVHI